MHPGKMPLFVRNGPRHGRKRQFQMWQGPQRHDNSQGRLLLLRLDCSRSWKKGGCWKNEFSALLALHRQTRAIVLSRWTSAELP